MRDGTASLDRRRTPPPRRNEILRGGLLGGLDPAELADRFGTPFYVYDLDVVTRQVHALRAALPARVELAYAVKANPSLGVIAQLGALGLGADVASAGELEAVGRADIDAAAVVMTGPGKRETELAEAVDARIWAVTVESPGELERLIAIARSADRRVPILLRAGAASAAAHEQVRLVGDDGAGKFGMDEGDLLAAARRAATSSEIELLGVHAFGASNVTDAAALAAHVAETMALGRRVAAETGTPLQLVDAGGGLGIPYGTSDPELDLAAFGRQLADLDAAWRADPVTRETAVLLEPGRFLVGPAGAYVARVVDTKRKDGNLVAILDGGIHHLLRPALVGQEHRVRRLGSTRGGTSRVAPVTIAGPLCSGLDVLATRALMVPPRVGDLVAVLDVGAYGFTESMPFFLSHPVPAEVAIRGGRASLLRPRLEPATWLDWQRLPGP